MTTKNLIGFICVGFELGLAGVICVLASHSLKQNRKKEEAFKAYKTEIYKSLDIQDMILRGGSNNEVLDAEHRAIAKRVLDNQKRFVDAACTIEQFDERIESFKNLFNSFTKGIDATACTVEVQVAGKRLDDQLKLIRENSARAEEQRIRQQENEYKIKMLTTTLSGVNTIYNLNSK